MAKSSSSLRSSTSVQGGRGSARRRSPQRSVLRWLSGLVGLGLIAPTQVAGSHIDSIRPTPGWECFTGSLDGSKTFCLTDNYNVHVWREGSLGSTGRQNIGGVLDSEYRPTDLAVTFATEPKYVNEAETDIIFQQNEVSGSDTGVTWCNDALGPLKCDQHYNAFDSANPSAALACHEIGHAVGLMHKSDAVKGGSDSDSAFACMQKPTPTSNLGVHNSQEINRTYP